VSATAPLLPHVPAAHEWCPIVMWPASVVSITAHAIRNPPTEVRMNNARYAELLGEIAALLQVKGANAFKVRAFERAARVVEGLAEPLDAWADRGPLTAIDGIGKSIASDLMEMRERGSCAALDALRDELPAGITDLLRVQGLGPKKVKKLYDELAVGDLDTLEELAREGRLAEIDGFGAKTEAKILREIKRVRSYAGRTPIARALPVAEQIVAHLRALPGVARAEIAGSLRRGRETVGDLDFVVASDDPTPIMDAFANMDGVEEIIGKGDTKTSVRLGLGISADLRVVPERVFGATLHHFTGSKDHNVAIRSRALERGLRVSEWGVFERNGDAETPIACHTEADVFEAVGLAYIPPELREDSGEVEAADSGTLPALVETAQIHGDLHMHTTYSDGRHEVHEMADAAHACGLSYIAITDHSQALTVARGLTRERLEAQIEEIDAFNAQGHAVHVLRGLEVDILEDGAIDMDAEVLERLDWVVGSVHSRMNQSADVMTARLVAAVRSGLISAIGHPTGRLIGHRDPYAFDLDAVLDACEEMNVALEINASLERLDLDAPRIRQVLDRPSLWLTINTDAHATGGLSNMVHGVRMARRGWAPATRVLNTLPLDVFLDTRRAPRAVERTS